MTLVGTLKHPCALRWEREVACFGCHTQALDKAASATDIHLLTGQSGLPSEAPEILCGHPSVLISSPEDRKTPPQ